jgi:hypothetical protein
MSDEARARLAAAQAALVAAVAGDGDVPPGFDRSRLGAAAASLAAKRSRAAARAWPGLADALGDDFARRFAAFAARAPLPRHGGPLADGWAFARALAAAGELPESLRPQLVAVGLRYAECADGLRPRRGLSARAALLRRPRRLLLAVRLPWVGERWLTVPLARRTKY